MWWGNVFGLDGIVCGEKQGEVMPVVGRSCFIAQMVITCDELVMISGVGVMAGDDVRHLLAASQHLLPPTLHHWRYTSHDVRMFICHVATLVFA